MVRENHRPGGRLFGLILVGVSMQVDGYRRNILRLRTSDHPDWPQFPRGDLRKAHPMAWRLASA
jgi:hypothetical protein